MKKSQITIFIVLGIVIMIIFGLMYFVKNSTSEIVLEKKINKIYGDFLTSTNIKEIVNGCLDKTTKEALLLAGLQSGRIYDYQIKGGYHINNPNDFIPFNFTGRNPNGTIYNVTYGIKARTTDMPYPDAPDYPYPGSLVERPASMGAGTYPNNQYAHLFSFKDGSKDIFPSLCSPLGSNAYNLSVKSFTCETYSINESIQWFLEKYLDQNLGGCINFTFKTISSYDFSSGGISVVALVGDEDMFVFLNYPIILSTKNKPPITKYLEFNIRPKIRLKRMHELASHLIGKYFLDSPRADADNIFFNITREDPNDCYNMSSPCILSGIKVFKLQDYCINYFDCNLVNSHYDYSDILIVEDDKSIIDGKPFRFQFAIENRRPALDFIDENVSSDSYYYKYINQTCKQNQDTGCNKNLSELYNLPNDITSNEYNVIMNQTSSTQIFPLGVDPDEDYLKYTLNLLDSIPGLVVTDILNGTPRSVRVQHGGTSTGYATLRINVSDNEGLYDYQDVVIRVV